ncbi:MAG: deiodinase-related protein, partial [Chloroflexota bacterium]
MNDRPDAEPYNYEEFVGSEDFLAFRTALPVGS